MWSLRRSGRRETPPRLKMFLSQSLAILSGKPVGLRQELRARHPVRIRTEHPLVHLGASVELVGLLPETERFFLIVSGDETLIGRGMKGIELEPPVGAGAARP